MFARRDIVQFLLSDSDAYRPEGHVSNSRAYRLKVLDNPIMNSDPRHQALIGTTAGVPLFDDQRRGCWPFVMRSANMPDTLSMDAQNSHLSLLSANEYWEVDEDAQVGALCAPRKVSSLTSP